MGVFRTYNDPWVFLARLVSCDACGAVNRVYVDDPNLAPVCGKCKARITPVTAEHRGLDEKRLKRNGRRFPYPPRPNSWWRRLGREIGAVLVHGALRTKKDRESEAARYQSARQIYLRLCEEAAGVLQAESEEELRRNRAADAAHEREAAAKRAEEEAEAEQRKEAAKATGERRRATQAGRLEEKLRRIDGMEAREFRAYLREVFEAAGYRAVAAKQTESEGVDLIVTGEDQKKWAISAKRYAAAVSVGAVQECFTGISVLSCQGGIVIAASGFTSAAQRIAKKTGVLLWTTADLKRILEGEKLI